MQTSPCGEVWFEIWHKVHFKTLWISDRLIWWQACVATIGSRKRKTFVHINTCIGQIRNIWRLFDRELCRTGNLSLSWAWVVLTEYWVLNIENWVLFTEYCTLRIEYFLRSPEYWEVSTEHLPYKVYLRGVGGPILGGSTLSGYTSETESSK